MTKPPPSHAPAPADRGPLPGKRRRAWKIALAILALIAIAIAALIGYGLSERGLPFVVTRIVAQTGGRITVEEPTGAVGGTMRFRRITWHGSDATVVADDVVVDWNPAALWSKRLSIRGLGARHVDIAVKPSPGPTRPPTDLRLPLSVDIDRLAVAELEWRAGPRRGRVSGLEFGYAGDAELHRIRALRLVSDYGRLEGDLRVGAVEPLAISGHAAIVGDTALAGATADAELGGTAAQIAIAAKGKLRDALLSLTATATPFSEAPFASAIVDLTDVDGARFDPALPHSRARLHLEARPQGSGIAGTVDAQNDDPGPLDAGRFPLAQMSARFVYDNDTLRLDTIDARVQDRGSMRGDARVVVAGAARTAYFALDVRELDLAHVDTRLVSTRLSGTLRGDANAERQTLAGDIRDRDVGLAFAAVITEERIDVGEFRATTAGGAVAGSARVALDAANAFTVQAKMQRLDPSRFVAAPRSALDGTISAKGVLRPRWRADAALVVAQGSVIDGLPASGSFKGTLSQGAARDVTLDATLASATLHATGAAGAPGDRLAFTVDAPRIAEIAALLPNDVPRPVAGALAANGTLTLQPDAIGGDIDVRGRSRRVGSHAAHALTGHASLSPPTPAARTIDARTIAIDASINGLTLDARTFETVRATASGTLERHHATLSLRASDVDGSLSVDGSLTNIGKGAPPAWTGSLTALENRGSVPVKLRAPATLAIRNRFLRIADAHVDVTEGRADIAELTWNEGRITTRGAFTNIALANVASLAGRPLPVASTLVIGGEWTIAATPRLNGRFTLQRERGDIIADAASNGTTEPHPLGISALTLAGTFSDDALNASATFASERAGTASGTLSLGTVAGTVAGVLDKAAPLRLALRAELASLAVFQPWIGTNAAVNGRARLDVAATGTLGNPLWSGTVAGDALRIDAPQYGVNVTDGRLRAHLAADGIVLDDARFTGGDGTFTATGLIALPGQRRTAATRVTWNADRVRIANRPDRRLVINGEGTVTIEHRRLALAGSVGVVEGHFELERAPSGKLASDIVVKGRDVPSRRESDTRTLPLELNVDVDLGSGALTFAGEGIETGLAGSVRITTSARGTLTGRGTIRAVNGTYFVFGQKLTIDRGRLIFDGPLDNPALDVVALRKNLAVEAGVELSGTVKVPQARITSNPPVPENEALAWLVTGQGLSNSSRVDYAALSAASAALLGRSGKPFTAQLAQRIGLDDISLQSSSAAKKGTGTSGAEGTASQVVVFGKRISDRLSLGYEQGLSLASSALRLEYALSRQITLRAEAGGVSGVGVVYRRNFQ